MPPHDSGLVKVEVSYIDDLDTLEDLTDVELAASQRNATSQLVPTTTLQDLQSDLLADVIFHVEGQRQSRLDTDQQVQQIREGSKFIVVKKTGARSSSSSSRRWSFVGSNTFKYAMREQACQDKELDKVLEALLEELRASDRDAAHVPTKRAAFLQSLVKIFLLSVISATVCGSGHIWECKASDFPWASWGVGVFISSWAFLGACLRHDWAVKAFAFLNGLASTPYAPSN